MLLKASGVEFKAVELDQMANGDQVQATLASISGQKTVPNIFINKEHIGGWTDVSGAHQSGALKSKLDAAGISNTL